jgi:putative alpha-1,2-mannosidase
MDYLLISFLCVCVNNKGDKWAYSFDVVHDIPKLIEYRGGNVKFIQSLDDHFNGGYNDHTNEVSADFIRWV